MKWKKSGFFRKTRFYSHCRLINLEFDLTSLFLIHVCRFFVVSNKPNFFFIAMRFRNLSSISVLKKKKVSSNHSFTEWCFYTRYKNLTISNITSFKYFNVVSVNELHSVHRMLLSRQVNRLISIGSVNIN